MMEIIFVITEINYLVIRLFNDLVRSLLFYICDVKLFCNSFCFNLTIAKEEAMPLPKVIQPIQIGAY